MGRKSGWIREAPAKEALTSEEGKLIILALFIDMASELFPKKVPQIFS
jgi:hypothetical protein